MSVTTSTHLNFHGEAREALTFYGEVFGGEPTVATYARFGMPADAPGAGRVVFGQVESATGFRVMAYDVPGADGPRERGTTTRRHGTTVTTEPFFVSVRGDTVEEVQRYWDALAVGADVVEAFGPAPWSPAFGMLTDRFGVTWILDVAAAR
ncbi:VOC family protein [Jatrophihabitans sp. YIM 134969]